MKRLIHNFIKHFGSLILLVICASVSAHAQNARIQLDALDRLADKASDTIDVTIDENHLKLASKFLSDKKIDEKKVKEIVSALKGVYVKSFKFETAGEYTKEDLDAIRSQLSAPGWSHMVGVRSRRNENIDVYLMSDADNIIGITVIAADRRQLTVVNVVGPIDLEKLAELHNHFGIPDFDFDIKP